MPKRYFIDYINNKEILDPNGYFVTFDDYHQIVKENERLKKLLANEKILRKDTANDWKKMANELDEMKKLVETYANQYTMAMDALFRNSTQSKEKEKENEW